LDPQAVRYRAGCTYSQGVRRQSRCVYAKQDASVIIDRYMIREVGLPFIAVSAVLLIIFTTYSLTSFLMDANAGLLKAG